MRVVPFNAKGREIHHRDTEDTEERKESSLVFPLSHFLCVLCASVVISRSFGPPLIIGDELQERAGNADMGRVQRER